MCEANENINFEIVDFGIYEIKASQPIYESNLLASQRSVGGTVQLIKSSSIINGSLGTVFGLRFKLTDKSKMGKSQIKIVTKYPFPGIKDPKTGVIHLQDEYMVPVVFGEIQTTYYRLSQKWEIASGTWVKEIWYEGVKVGEKQFSVTANKN